MAAGDVTPTTPVAEPSLEQTVAQERGWHGSSALKYIAGAAVVTGAVIGAYFLGTHNKGEQGPGVGYTPNVLQVSPSQVKDANGNVLFDNTLEAKGLQGRYVIDGKTGSLTQIKYAAREIDCNGVAGATRPVYDQPLSWKLSDQQKKAGAVDITTVKPLTFR